MPEVSLSSRPSSAGVDPAGHARAMLEQPVHQRAGGVAIRRVHHQARRLVDRQQVVVFVEDLEMRSPAACGFASRRDVGDAHAQLVAGLHAPGRPRRRRAVDQDIAGLDPFLDAIARHALLVAQVAQQHAIDAHAVVAAIELDRPPVEVTTSQCISRL